MFNRPSVTSTAGQAVFVSVRKAFIAGSMLLSSAAFAGPISAEQFTPERSRSHVRFLADDLLEGRNAGDRGYDVAALYVATQFEALGLQPPFEGNWLQQVPMAEYKLGEAPAAAWIGDKRFEHGDTSLIAANPRSKASFVEAPAVFVGYGIDMPSRGFDDYSGLDVKGKIVVALTGTPKDTPSDLAAHFVKSKAAMAMANGAVGLIHIRPRELSQKVPIGKMAQSAGATQVAWVRPDGELHVSAPSIAFTAMLDPAAEDALFKDAPRTLPELFGDAANGIRPRGFPLEQTVRLEGKVEIKKLNSSPNVLAVLPGSDPAVADEYVLLMAHLDGLGIDASKSEGDRIRNGALDNATGVSALLETARVMATSGQRPRRSILFAAVTSEEDGLLGSEYLAMHPVIGNGHIVGVVNLDMPILLYDFQDVIAFGAEHSTLGEIVRKAGEQMGVALSADPLPQEALFTRSDHYRFVQAGIPSIFLMTGFADGGDKKFKDFLSTDYHRVSDDLNQKIDWGAAAKFAKMNYLIAREIADSPQPPRWHPDSPFAVCSGKASSASRQTASRC